MAPSEAARAKACRHCGLASALLALRAAVLGSALIANPIRAQDVPRVAVGPVQATFPGAFSQLTSVRELDDTTVLLTDYREQRVVTVDLRTGSQRQVGRLGRGPGEYESVRWLFALAGDSTLMALGLQRRWLLFKRDRVVATLPPNDVAVLATRGFARGADTLGHVLAYTYPVAPVGYHTYTAKDSFFVSLVDRQTGRSDSVAALRRMPKRTYRMVDAAGRAAAESEEILGDMATEEAAVLFSDGWLAVARLEPFAVDWRSPDGDWIRGRPLSIASARVDRRQRRWWAARTGRADDEVDLPKGIPPFLSRSAPLYAASDGRLLILRAPDADHEYPRYVVVNRRGVLDGELSLARNERILGFGRAAVYVVVADDAGLEHLKRYAWPSETDRGK